MVSKVIDDFCLEKMRLYNKEFPVVYTTLQMYRSDKLDYLKSLINLAKKEKFYLGVKLVRGAYIHKEDEWAKAHQCNSDQNKEAADKAYNNALEICFENLDHVALFAGTHNTESIQLFSNLVAKIRIVRNT